MIEKEVQELLSFIDGNPTAYHTTASVRNILILAPEYLRAFSEYRMLIFGAIMVIMMIFRPQGLVTGERRRYRITALQGGNKGERA